MVTTPELVPALVLLCAMLVLTRVTFAAQTKDLVDSANDKVIKRASFDVSKVITLISNAREDVKLNQDKALSTTDDLVKEELDMLEEDAVKLRDNILSGAVHPGGGLSNEDPQRYPINVQSQASLLSQDTEDLISDARYGRQLIRTHTDVAFDRDLEILRKQTERVLSDVRSIKPHKIQMKTERRHRKPKQGGKSEERTTLASTKTKRKSPSHDNMLADQPVDSPIWRDPLCDDVLRSHSVGDALESPATLTLSRSRFNSLDFTCLFYYLQACPQCTISSQDSQCPLTNKVLEMKKWANELQELLTHGCIKPAGCNYPGTCCITAEVPIEQAIVRITDMLKDVYDMFHRTCMSCSGQGDTLGEWLPWGEWSSCGSTCGRGMRSRSRRCVSGSACKGDHAETESCVGLPECCVDTNWSNWENWTPCSVTCGRGQAIRRRRCSRPAPNSCGQPCVGPREESRVCLADKECSGDDGVLGDWFPWSEWSICDSTCGSSARSRSRVCRPGGICTGDHRETALCPAMPGCCIEANWSSWENWSPCPVTCGRGQIFRRRRCSRPGPNSCGRSCVGSADETRICLADRDCSGEVGNLDDWLPWGEWSSCDATCGSSERTRARLCMPRGLCPGNEKETVPCRELPGCCVDTNWSSWENWTPCSVTCGHGQTIRRRRCSRPAPNSCGQPCVGSREESRVCFANRECSGDGGILGDWLPWGEWSSCDSTCGSSGRTRSRLCKPGGNCPGEQKEAEQCTGLPDCCVDGGWSNWDNWSSCPVTCGRGQTIRRRRCSRPAPDYCGKTCVGPREENRPCDTNVDCCVDGNWASWSSWTPCSSSCGEGRKARDRICSNPPPSSCGRGCLGELQQLVPCSNTTGAVTGNWGAWQPWSACSASCGRGVRKRRRLCDSPPPGVCGQTCVGDDSENGSCDSGRSCCVNGNWGSWSSWTSCSSSCGEGWKARDRICSNPPPSSCGRGCQGDIDEMVPCSNTAGTVESKWNSWQAWSACSVTCDVGTKRRLRTCDIPSPNPCGEKCPGENVEMTACVVGVSCKTCVNGNWGNWQHWSPCSVSCGRGARERIRTCDNPPPNQCGQRCQGRGFQENKCDTGRSCEVCVDGGWSSWENWTPCSVTCGPGETIRRRQCSRPAPNHCGKPCDGPMQEARICLADRECSDWLQWTEWSSCDATCGSAQRSRSRDCKPGGTCPGDPTETSPCTGMPDCCVDGNWASWSSWTSCSSSCGEGWKARDRICSNPPPSSCGRGCQGEIHQLVPCSNTTGTVDGDWSSWGGWTSCSVTCGRGQAIRSRLCNRPAPNSCGKPCVGPREEPRLCQADKECSGEDDWLQWTEWSGCDATCGNAERSRSRDCKLGGTCPGDGEETSPCTGMPDCCVNGNWGQWQAWSGCSMTCGKGTIERRRACDSPPADECGERCPGREFETGICEAAVECIGCVDGNWGAWHSWSGCTVTCGRGTRERRRSCDNPPFNYCGAKCPGLEFNTDVCETGRVCETCVDGNWGPWQTSTSCSVTCGRGLRDRVRSCDSPSANYCGRTCPGLNFDSTTCDSGIPCQECVDGNWGPWQSLTACSVTCGRGLRDRLRSCDSPSANYCGRTCPGLNFDSITCDSGIPCQECVDGNWGQWQTSTSCSVTCGRGLRDRLRSCDSPSANYCGRTCPGLNFDSITCDSGIPCQECVNGNWSPWTQWSGCSASCGDAVVERSRICNSPPPNYCGSFCEGPATDIKLDRCGPPRIDGQWSGWSSWSTCSVSCGIGSITRSRSCNNPAPNECGLSCPAQTDERVTCKGAGLCDCAIKEWTTWESWSPCSASCGSAFRRRSRSCQVVAPGNDCGSECIGVDQEELQCEGFPACPSSWGLWSPCSVTCRGSGVRERNITFTQLVRRGDMTVETNGTRRETDTQCGDLLSECPTWSQWSACSATCRGQGFRERVIATSSSNVGTGGLPVGTDQIRTEIETCNITDPECGTWGAWSACSATCRGSGTRVRTISTVSTEIGTSGVPVGTDATRSEYSDCVATEPECPYGDPGWSQWENWCPCDCRHGVRTRRRDCEKASLLGMNPQKIPIALCQGEARNEEQCDTRLQCPECITDCGNLPPGQYPSCISCSHYKSCPGAAQLDSPCTPVYTEWDAFVKSCVTAPSPSCMLQDCVSTCEDTQNGTYHSCIDCNSYVECVSGLIYERQCPPQMEWNQHRKKCEAERSPTCKRRTGLGGRISIIGGAFQRDAPRNQMKDKKRGHSITQRKKQLDQQTSDDKLQRMSDIEKQNFDKKSTKLKQESREKSKIANCRTHCRGADEGKYPSCRGCEYYVLCTKYGVIHHRRCNSFRKWDDFRKICKSSSSTCLVAT